VVKEINTPRMPNFSGKMKAKKMEIPLLTAEDIGAEEQRLGLKGSPTRVVKIFHPQVARKGKVVSAAGDLDSAVDGLVDFLAGKAII
jgi:electron transfer flavoprotein beta subunit